MRLTSFERLREILNSDIVVLEGRSILMVKPTELLEDFGMLGVCLNDAFICASRSAVLTKHKEKKKERSRRQLTFFCCSKMCLIWNQISACARGLGGLRRMRSKQSSDSSNLPCCL
jgi:hypothetical protein